MNKIMFNKIVSIKIIIKKMSLTNYTHTLVLRRVRVIFNTTIDLNAIYVFRHNLRKRSYHEKYYTYVKYV